MSAGDRHRSARNCRQEPALVAFLTRHWARPGGGTTGVVQTFLPYPDFAASAVALDCRRLGKQRVEALQILRALTRERYGWKHHPAVRMGAGYEDALARYAMEICAEVGTLRPFPSAAAALHPCPGPRLDRPDGGIQQRHQTQLLHQFGHRRYLRYAQSASDPVLADPGPEPHPARSLPTRLVSAPLG
jgi:Pyrimidine dimer DNA glycosylase